MVSINTGQLAINVFHSNQNLSHSIERLSTQKRLITDNPSRLVATSQFKKYISASSVVLEGLEETKAAFHVAADAATAVLNILQAMRELSIAAQNPDLDANELATMQNGEFARITNQINEIASTTKFKDTLLADASWITNAGKDIIVGPDPSTDLYTAQMQSGQALDLTGATLGIDALDISADAAAATTQLRASIDRVASNINSLGVTINAIEDFETIQMSTRSNLESAMSAVEGVDVANEMAKFTKASVIQQASISMLAQGNLASQNMLALFA